MISRTVDGVSYLVSYDGPNSAPDPSALYKPSPEREAELAAMPYREYLASGEWKEKRRLKLHESQHTCERCGRHREDLQVHHLTYERRGCELSEDLAVLCPGCHRYVHGIAA